MGRPSADAAAAAAARPRNDRQPLLENGEAKSPKVEDIARDLLCDYYKLPLTRPEPQPECVNCSFKFRSYAIVVMCLLATMLTAVGQYMNAFSVAYGLKLDAGIFRYEKSGRTFEFNMWQGAAELANVDMWYLSFLVYVWSGFWPYIKIIFILAAVSLEARWIPSKCFKGPVDTLIPVVQYLGKWAFLDVCVVMIIGVVLHIEGTKGMASFYIQTIVMEGQFVFMAGIALCLIAQTFTSRHQRPRIYSSVQTPFGSAAAVHDAFLDADTVTNTKTVNEISGWNAVLPPIFLTIVLVIQTIGNFCDFIAVEASFNPEVKIMQRSYSIVEGFNDMTETIHGTGRLNAGHAVFGYIFVTLMPIVTGILMLIAWMVPGRPEVREKALHWACILREWSLLDVYWLASIVSMFELPEIASYIADEFKDIGRFGRIELTMTPRHTLFWLPIVMSVENVVFFHMKTRLDSEPELTFGKFTSGGH